MLKRSVVLLFVMATLIGCTLDDEIKTLKNQASSNDFDVLVETKKELEKIVEEGEKDRQAKKVLKDVDKKIRENIRESINEAYSDKRLEDALKYSEMLVEMEPEDEEARDAYKRMSTEYKEQKEFDEVTEYAKGVFDELEKIYKDWDALLREAILKNRGGEFFQDFSRERLKTTQDLTRDIEERRLLTENDVYREVLSDLHSYSSNIEKMFIDLLLDKKQSLSEVRNKGKILEPDYFTGVFLDIQSDMDDYINEVDGEGNKIRNINGNLRFGISEE